MSGGSLNYIYEKVGYAKEELEEYLDRHNLSLMQEGTINEMNEAVQIFEQFSVFAKELEWYMSSDTGPEDFKKAYDTWRKNNAN